MCRMITAAAICTLHIPCNSRWWVTFTSLRFSAHPGFLYANQAQPLLKRLYPPGRTPRHVIMRSLSFTLFCFLPCPSSVLSSRIIIRQAAPATSQDPCGPKVQGQVGEPTNSCNGSAIPPSPVAAPAIYANYLDDNQAAQVSRPQHSGDPGTLSQWALGCKTSIDYVCTGLGRGAPGTWQTNTDGGSCSVKAWLPDAATGGAPVPAADHCRNDILFPMLAMLDIGANLNINRASINIAAGGFPSGLSTGVQIDSGYASWIIQ